MLQAALVISVAGCGDTPAPIDPCILDDGTLVADGDSPAGDPCVACNGRSGELVPVFGPCASVDSYSGVAPQVWWEATASMGPDADGDGLGDIVIAGLGDEERELRGQVEVVSTRDGTSLLALEGERPAERLGVGGNLRNVQLGPDADGDGLADLVVSPSNIFVDRDLSNFEGGAPHPGRVELWGVAGAELLQRWEGTVDECSLGRVVMLLPDVSGDELGDVLMVEGGCVTYGEDLNGDPIVTGWTDDALTMRSGVTGEQVWSLEPSDRPFAGFGSGVWLVAGRSEPRLAYMQRGYIGLEVPSAVRHLDLQGTLTREWPSSEFPIVDSLEPWAVGVDMNGDTVADAVGPARSPSTGVVLYPSVQRPVDSVVGYSDCELGPGEYHIVPDVDADGRPDVFVECASGQRVMRLVGGATGAVVWSRALDESGGAWTVAEPLDIDGDGCVDLAAFQASTSTLEIVRCAGG